METVAHVIFSVACIAPDKPAERRALLLEDAAVIRNSACGSSLLSEEIREPAVCTLSRFSRVRLFTAL